MIIDILITDYDFYKFFINKILVLNMGEEEDLRKIEEHNQKSVEELVENFSEVHIYFVNGTSVGLNKDSEFKFENGKFKVFNKNLEVDIVDIDFIEFCD